MSRYLILGLCAVLAVSGAAEAKDPPPFKDFKPRFVKAQRPGAKRVALPQIQPKEEPAAVAKAPKAPSKPVDARFGWFWNEISPAMSDAGPGRLDDAIRTLKQSKSGVPVPRLQTLQDIARLRGVDILKATIGTEVSPALALAVIWTESAGKADATSRAGAQGLMQLMPATAQRFGVNDAFQPSQNIVGGVKYLDWLMKEFKGDPMLVLAAYNSGEGSVRKHKGVPPFAETRDYVPKVLATFQIARGLCITPPELITDGCVFAGMGS